MVRSPLHMVECRPNALSRERESGMSVGNPRIKAPNGISAESVLISLLYYKS